MPKSMVKKTQEIAPIKSWPADKLERRPTVSLIPYARNSRTHSAEQIAQIAASIKEWGFTNPILIDAAGGIIAGHGRLLAAQKLGIDEVPCIIAEGWTDAQKKAYVIADNKLALNAGWDNDMLAVEFGELKELGFDLPLTGFSDDEIAALSPQIVEGLTDEDAVPEAPANPKTVLGDIWLLGNHRLMCGDSTSIDAVGKLMDGQKADMVFTSPPYNANTSFGTLHKVNMGKLYDNGYSDDLPSEQYVSFAESVLSLCFIVTDGFIFWNVNYNSNSRFEFIKQISSHLHFLVETICWKKNSIIPYTGGLRRVWEPIFVFRTEDSAKNVGSNEIVQDNFWEISNTNSQVENHRGCFPLALPEKGISLVRPKTGIVFDPFGGSGTTLIACEKTGRINRSMELDPKYCDVIIKRWQDFTGKKAINADTGASFDDS